MGKKFCVAGAIRGLTLVFCNKKRLRNNANDINDVVNSMRFEGELFSLSTELYTCLFFNEY